MMRRAPMLASRASMRAALRGGLPLPMLSAGAPSQVARISTTHSLGSRIRNDRPRFSRFPAADNGGRGGRSNEEHPDRHQEGIPPEQSVPAQISAELQAPVVVPDDPDGVLSLTSDPEVGKVLGQSALIVTRQLEFLNVFIGFEQANKYALLTPDGQPAGYLAEEGVSLASSLKRNFFATSRPFTATLFSAQGTPLLLFRRGFTLINSAVQVFRLDPAWNGAGYGARAQEIPGTDGVDAANQAGMRLIGESQQKWHMWRRQYELFESRPDHRAPPGENQEVLEQFAKIDAPVLSWDFTLVDKNDRLMGAINRNFRGLQEFFTDTGQYVLRFDSVANDQALDPRLGEAQGTSTGRELVPAQGIGSLTLDQRATALAAAISIDYDFFSRYSSHGSGWGLPIFFPFPGAGPAAGAEAGAAGTEVGAAGAGAAGSAAEAGAGAAAGAAAAGYGFGQQGQSDPWGQAPSDTANDPWGGTPQAPSDGGAPSSGWPGSPDSGVGGEEVWGESDPWSDSGSNGGDGGGGGGLLQGLWDSLSDE